MRRACLSVALAIAALGCRQLDRDRPDPGEDPDADPAHPFPPPRTDVVPAAGSDATFEIATWNIRNFPADSETASAVADVIASLDLDVVVVEEIASEAAWDELIARLRDYTGILSSHRYNDDFYQKIGVIYRTALISAGPPRLLFTQDTFAFPRPPLAVTLTLDGTTFDVVGVHLKAGVTTDDAERRRSAVIQLDELFRAQVDGGGEPEVILLGDYNERVIVPDDRDVLAPLLTAPDRYTVRTEPGALAGDISYLGFGGSMLDHITTTAALDAKWATGRVEVQRVDQHIASYSALLSDHLPVVLIAPR